MNLYDLLMNAKIIDVHVHDELTKSDIKLQFPKPFIPDIVCNFGNKKSCLARKAVFYENKFFTISEFLWEKN